MTSEVSEFDKLDSLSDSINSSDVIKAESIKEFLLLAGKLKGDLKSDFFSVKKRFNVFYKVHADEVFSVIRNSNQKHPEYLCGLIENIDDIGIKMYTKLVELCDKHCALIENIDFLRKKLIFNLNKSYESNITSLSDKLVADLKPFLDKCIEDSNLTDKITDTKLDETDIKIPLQVKARLPDGHVVDKNIDIDFSLITNTYNHLQADIKSMVDNAYLNSDLACDECVTKYSFPLRTSLGDLYEVITMNRNLYNLIIDFKSFYNSVSEKTVECFEKLSFLIV